MSAIVGNFKTEEENDEYEYECLKSAVTNPYYWHKGRPIINFILDESTQQKKRTMWFIMSVMLFWICITSLCTVFFFLEGTHCHPTGLMSKLVIALLVYVLVTYLVLFCTEIISFFKASSKQAKLSIVTEQNLDMVYPNDHITQNALNKSRDHRTLIDLVAIGYRIKTIKIHQEIVQLNLCQANVTKMFKSKYHEENITKHQIVEAAKKLQYLSADSVNPTFSEKILEKVNEDDSDDDDDYENDQKGNEPQSQKIIKYIKIWILILVILTMFMVILSAVQIKDFKKNQNVLIDILNIIQEKKTSISSNHKYDFNWRNWCNIWYQSYILVINLIIVFTIVTTFSICIQKV